DPAQAAKQNLFSDFQRRARSGLCGDGTISAAGSGLDLSLLSRPRAMPDAWRDATGNTSCGRGSEGRSHLRRAADAVAWGAAQAGQREQVAVDGVAIGVACESCVR